MIRAALLAGLVAWTGGGASQPPREITPATVTAIDRWVGAVLSHAPGEADSGVRAVWAMTIEDRRALHPGMTLLLDAVARKRVTPRGTPAERIAAIGWGLARRPGAADFVKRAAVLHGDAAMAGYTRPVSRPVPDIPLSPVSRTSAQEYPLLVDRQLYLENDGQVVGMSVADWNWMFARSLLDRIKPASADPFVGEWYHATAAFMFRNRIFGEVSWHLDRAAEVLSNDARILLDRGCAEEHQGLPRSQAALSDEDLADMRLRRPGGLSSTGRRGSIGLNIGIQPLETANRNAEAFFRRAVARDPRLFEARVRLARLLTLRSKWDDALEVITSAPAGTAPDKVAEYYAHLFAARAERALGRLDAAASRIRQARDLFPDAQSALMAASHIAMLRADQEGADEPMRRLAVLPDERGPAGDPWWDYETFTGRYADALVAAMWKNSPRD